MNKKTQHSVTHHNKNLSVPHLNNHLP